jgi:ABC-type polysaccharide/polyol phosphate transport system ATPase subunit
MKKINLTKAQVNVTEAISFVGSNGAGKSYHLLYFYYYV